jgi:hypothetical protein
MALVLAVDWTPADGAAIPESRPFMLFLGITIFVAALNMTWRSPSNGPPNYSGRG